VFRSCPPHRLAAEIPKISAKIAEKKKGQGILSPALLPASSYLSNKLALFDCMISRLWLFLPATIMLQLLACARLFTRAV
jgi:hypothetical protein